MKYKGYWCNKNYFLTYFQDAVAPQLTHKHVKNSKAYIDRIETFHSISKGSVMVEVGTILGEYDKLIHQIYQPKELHIIDLEFRNDCLYSYITLQRL